MRIWTAGTAFGILSITRYLQAQLLEWNLMSHFQKEFSWNLYKRKITSPENGMPFSGDVAA